MDKIREVGERKVGGWRVESGSDNGGGGVGRG